MMKRTEDDTRDGSSYQFLDLTDAGQNEASALMGILYPASSDASSVAQEPSSSRAQQRRVAFGGGPPMPRPKEVVVEQQQHPTHEKAHFHAVLPQELTQLNGLNPNARAFDPVPVVFLPRPLAGAGPKPPRSFGKEFPTELENVPVLATAPGGPGGPGASGGMMIVPMRKHSLVSAPNHPLPLLAQSTPPLSLATASAAGTVGIVARSSALLSAGSGGSGGGSVGLLRTASIVTTSTSAPPLPNFVNEGNSSSFVIDTEKVLGSGEQWIGFSVQSTATSVAAGGGGGGGGGEVIARTSIVTAATMPPHTNNPHHLQQQQQQHQQQLGSGANNQQQQTGGQQQPGQGPPQQQPHNVGGRSGGGGNGAGGGVTAGGDTAGGRNADRDNGNQQQMQQQQAVSVSNPHQQQMLPHMYTPIPASAYIPPAPHGMYPVQMLPPTAAQVPNNVFVGNLTANVSVHGYPAISPYLATTATPPGAYMQADVGAGPEMQLMPPAPVTMSGRGTMRRGGRNNRGGNNSRSRGGYVPHYIQQQQQHQQQQQQSYHHQQQHAQSYHQSLAQQQQQQQGVMHHQGGQPQMQQHQVQQQQSQQGVQGGGGQQQTPPTSVSGGGQQSQQQPQHPPQQHTPELMHIEGPPMMSAAGAQYGNLHGGFYLLPHMPQHASGTPLFMAAPQMQMYYNAPLHGYPNLVYPYIPSEYQIYDDGKGDDGSGGPPHGGQGQGHDDPGVHPGAAMWPQPPPHMTLDYHPETGEYLPVHEDDGATAGMLPQGPPPPTMGHHVLDPNVPGFTMQMAPAPIVSMQQQPPDEYGMQPQQQSQQQQPQVEDYNGNGNIPVSSNAPATTMHSPLVVTSVAQHNIVGGIPQPEEMMVSGGYLVGPAAPPQPMTTMEGSTEVLMVAAEHQQQHPGQPQGGVIDGAQPMNNNFIVDPQYIQAHPPPPPPHHVPIQPTPHQQQSALQQQQQPQQQQYQPVPTPPQGAAVSMTDSSPPSTTNQSFQVTQHTVAAAGVVAGSLVDANGNDTNNNSSVNRKADIVTSPKLVDAVVMTNHSSPLPSSVNASSTTTPSPQQNERTSPAMTMHQRGSEGSSAASKQASNVPNQGFQQQQQQQQQQQPILGYAAAVASQAPPRTRSEQQESSIKGTHERMEKLSLKDQEQRRTGATAVASAVVGGGVNPQRSSAPQPTGRQTNADSGWVNNSGVGPKKGTASVSVSAIPNKEFPPGASGGQHNKNNTSPVPFTTLVGTVATAPSSSITSTSLSSSKQQQQQQQQKPFSEHNQRPSSAVNASSSSAASGTISSGAAVGGGSIGPAAVVPPQMESKKVEAIPQRTVAATAAAASAPVTASSVGAADATKQQQHHQDVVIVPRSTTTTTTSTSISTNTNTVKSATKAPVVINHPLNIPPPDHPLNIPPPIIVPPPQIPPGGAPPQPNKTWASLFQTSSSSSSSSPSSSASSMLSSAASSVSAAPAAATAPPPSAVTVSAVSSASSGTIGPAAAPSTTTPATGAMASAASQHHASTAAAASSGVNFAASSNRATAPAATTTVSSSPTVGSTPSSNDAAASTAGAKKPVAKVQPYERNYPQPSATAAPMSYSSAAASTPTSGTGSSLSQMSASAKGKGTQTAASKKTSAGDANASATGSGPGIGDVKDDFSLKFGDFLSGYSIDNGSISITPRGLINRSNYCYINTILQALVACPPFYHLMRTIRNLPAAKNSKHPKPFIDAMCSLVSEFSQLPIRSKPARGDKGKKDDIPEIQVDTPFEPTVIYKMLNGIRSDMFQIEGRQEDAEEFLGCVLNRLNDEMIEFMKFNKTEQGNVNGEEPANGEVHGEEDADDWMVICGNRNKGTVTRTTDFGRSPISDIFRGKLRSRVQRDGVPPTYNIQPFFTLPLDIEKAASVKEALEQLVGRDELEGVTCSKTKQEVAAWQQVTLEELPVVLILHLKCFDYKMDGCTKILKTLDFPIELKIDSKLMSSKGKSYSAKQKQYKLFAVVYHDGKEASKGHYITDVYHSGYGSWIRYDDSIVKPIPEYSVLRPRAPRVPYLLYYRRMDTQSHGSNSDHRGGGGGGGGGDGIGGGGAGGGGGRGGSSHSNTSSERNERQNVHHHHHHHHHGNDHHHGRGSSGGGYGGNGGYGSGGGGHGNSGGSHYGSGGGGQGNSGHYNSSK